MSRYPRIRFPQFLNCCKYIKYKDYHNSLAIFEKIEELAYGNNDSKNLLKMFKTKTDEEEDYEGLFHHIVDKYNLSLKVSISDDNKKKKAIKEGMIENYLVRLKKERGLSLAEIKGIMLRINLRLFLKLLSTKNVMVENGEIIDIDDPDLFPQNENDVKTIRVC